MKRITHKLITILTFLLFYISVSGQEETKKCQFGFHIAPGGSTLLGNYKDRRDFDYQIRCRFGYIGGVNIQYQIKPKFALCFETNYESKGAVFIFHNIFSMAPDGTGNATNLGTLRIIYITDYITTPVTTKLTINQNKVTWFANIGTYPSYLLRSGVREYPIHGALGPAYYYKPRNTIIINIGLITGIGFNTQIGKRSQFTMEARNNLNVYTIGNKGQSNKQATTLDSFNLLLGFSFKI